jgi:phenylacetate-CoA ligase
MTLPDYFKLAPKILERYLFFRKSQYWSRQQIDDYQDKKLIEIVQYAGKYVPYYRNLFKEIGLDTTKFRGREDITKIPYLDKDTLRKRTQEFVSDASANYDNQTEKTSGSTGTPLTLVIDQISRINKSAATLRAYFWAGYTPLRKSFLIKGLSESKKEPYGYDLNTNRIFLNCSRITKENSIGAAKLINKAKPIFYSGYGRSFIDFHRYISEDGITVPSPKGILCYGESVTPEMRVYLEKNFQTKLYDYYSQAENAVMICEMPDNHKYLMEDFFYPEIIDSEGNQSTDGYGELVGTSFYNYSMPLIRYRTRDYIRLAPSTNTNCAFRAVTNIEGRMDDNILLPDGRKIYFAEGAIGYANGVITAQIIQDEQDHLIINLIVDENFSESQYPEIEKGLIKRIGTGMRLTFKIVNELEKKSSGKTPFIINKMPVN